MPRSAIPHPVITLIFGLPAHLECDHSQTSGLRRHMNNGNPETVSIRFLYLEKMNDSHLNIFNAKEDFGDL